MGDRGLRSAEMKGAKEKQEPEKTFKRNPFMVYSDFTAASRFPVNRVALAERASSTLPALTVTPTDRTSSEKSTILQKSDITNTKQKRKRVSEVKREDDEDKELLAYINSSFHKVKGTLEREQTKLESEADFFEILIQLTYPALLENLHRPQYLKERMIVTHSNSIISKINTLIISRMPGVTHTYLSTDADNNTSNTVYDRCAYYENQVALHRIESDELPSHRLDLKIGTPIILLSNLQEDKLQKGTRLIITNMDIVSIEAQVLGGKKRGKTVILKRIEITSTLDDSGAILRRSQFPIRPSYACLISQSRSQCLSNIGIYADDNKIQPGKYLQCILNPGKGEEMKIVLIMNKDNEGYYSKVVLTQELYDNNPLIDRIIKDVKNTLQDLE